MGNDPLDTVIPPARRRQRKPKQAEDAAPHLALVPSPPDDDGVPAGVAESLAELGSMDIPPDEAPPPGDADYLRKVGNKPSFPLFEVGPDGVPLVLVTSDTIENYQTLARAICWHKGKNPEVFSDVGGADANLVELTRDPTTGAAAISAPWKREKLVSRLNGRYRWMKLAKEKKIKNAGSLVAEEAPEEVWVRKQIEKCPDLLVTALYGDVAGFGLPVLRGVKSGPFIDAGGRVVAAKGYDRETCLYLAEDVRPVMDGWTRENVKATLLDWLTDFPFVDDASRAHAIGCFFLPFVRPMIDGATMLHMIEAPASRSGKTLLAQTLMFPALGREISLGAFPVDEKEQQKTIWADLVMGKEVMAYDNAKAMIGGAFYEMVLTSRYPSGRILGFTQSRTVANEAVHLVTRNNGESTPDIANRSVQIRIDRGLSDPTSFTGYKHPDILAYTRENRAKLVGAALWAAREWHKAGATGPMDAPSDFREYGRVIGGILEYLGIPGFLGNRAAMKDNATPDEREWRGFMAAMLLAFPVGAKVVAGNTWDLTSAAPTDYTCSEAVKAAHLVELAKKLDLLASFRQETRSGPAYNFGVALGRQRDRVFDLTVETLAAMRKAMREVEAGHTGSVPLAGAYRLTGDKSSPVRYTLTRCNGAK